MRVEQKSFLGEASLIDLKDKLWLQRQQHAGKVVATCLKKCKKIIEESEGISLKELEAICEDIIVKEKCTPTFKNYKGFPGAICTSVNKQMVHGVPTDYKIKKGDVVTVDLGATFEGAIADAAVTAICIAAKSWQHNKLLECCKGALDEAILSLKVGNHLGCVGYAISKYVKKYSVYNFHLITAYGGHGISWNTPHASPFVSNKSKKDEGIRIQPGTVIAIEPIVAIGSNSTKITSDGWTVCGNDISAHYEHSVYIGEDSVETITKYD